MDLKKHLTACLCLLLTAPSLSATTKTPDFWKSATVYFLLTDRFNNGDTSNDNSYERTQQAAKLRGFEGGDIKGVIEKIEDGYFTELGVDAIWTTPVVEQVHGADLSAGATYAYHGYWPKDWTAVDANYGSEQDLAKLVETAHKHGIKILIDVIINHTGPETASDWAWPKEWIRTRPICNWKTYEQNTRCALATSLTDIKTESERAVDLPPQLIKKWQKEGRLGQELAELDAFFERTHYPRAPKYYLIKWLTDWVRDYGVDGFRVDTAKHIEADIWQVLKKESQIAFDSWKASNPQKVTHELPFYMVGEVYNWGIQGFGNTVKKGRAYDYGDKQVDFFDVGFDALINMGFVSHAGQSAKALFESYSATLNSPLYKDKGILSYLGSHDDHNSFDMQRKAPFDSALKLMLSPGAVQIYYGDELARPMHVKGAFADANMRDLMNWDDLSKSDTQTLLAHWQKLGQFRQAHPSIGAGVHTTLQSSPFVFKREHADTSPALVAIDMPKGKKSLSSYDLFEEGQALYDYYSQQPVTVKNGNITLSSPYQIVLIGQLPKE